MKIAYTCVYKALDINSWSGTSLFMAKMLERMGNDVYYVDQIETPQTMGVKIKYKLFAILSQKKFLYSREPKLLEMIAKEINGRTKNQKIDLIFTPGLRLLGALKTDIPTAFFSDATFAGLVDYYDDFTNLSKYTLNNSYRMERHALESAKLCVFSSKWAADSAIKSYNINPKKIRVCPFGSNFPYEPTTDEIIKNLTNKERKKLKLIFIGVNWVRKGGDVAIKIVKKLNKNGIPADLHIVGSVSKEYESIPDYIRIEGFLNKNKANDLEKLKELLAQVHFMILPTRAECTAIVYNEVNSYGIPALSTDTGGVSSVIKENENGHLFSSDDIDGYCEKIAYYHANRDKYIDLSINTYKYYKENLTWEVTQKKLKKYFGELKLNIL